MPKDRIQDCPSVPINDLKKIERRVHNHRSSAAAKIEIVRWHDNCVVTIGSNAYGLLPLRKVKRWKKDEGHMNVDQPAVIANYNNGIVRVDLIDRELLDCRPGIHGKNGIGQWFYWSIVGGSICLHWWYHRSKIVSPTNCQCNVTPFIQRKKSWNCSTSIQTAKRGSPWWVWTLSRT